MEAPQMSGLKPTERLFIEKTLIRMYPRLQCYDLPVWNWLNGSLIPDFIVKNTHTDTRRIVEIGCGDGVFSNILSLLFPNVEIISMDPNPHHIAYARTTVGFRQNLKFICGNAAVMSEIPCDRIIYNNRLAALGNTYAFKKLIMKTSAWLVEEGDFIVKESPLNLLRKPALLKALYPLLRRNWDMEACIRQQLADIGFFYPNVFQGKALLPGLPNEVFYQLPYQLPRQFTLPAIGAPARTETISEWHDNGDESTHSVLGFLFAEAETDFARVLAR
jgi:SAM-dependent methyltransferase